MGGAYSTGGGSGSGGGNQPPVGPGGGMNRLSDGRGGNNHIGGHSVDQNFFPWLNLSRSGQLPPSSGGNTMPIRAQPQLPQQQQQQQSAQPSIEELIASFARTDPNYLYSC